MSLRNENFCSATSPTCETWAPAQGYIDINCYVGVELCGDVSCPQVDSAQVKGSRGNSSSSSSSPRKHTKEAKGPTEAQNLNQPQTKETRTKSTGQPERGADAAPATPKGQANWSTNEGTALHNARGTGTNGKPDKLGTNNQQSIGMNMRPNLHLYMHKPRLNSHHVNPRVRHNPPKTRR